MLSQHGRISSKTKRTAAAGFVTAATLLLGASGAIAAGPHHHRASALGGSCRGSASAIAQYCEEIPTPGGGQHPGPGTPTLITTLPPAVVSRLGRSAALRPLLRVPAANAALPGAGGLGLAGGAPGLTGGADSSSIWAPIVLTLALVALVLGAIEIARRRRLVSRTGPQL
jgi:hypothetical protein